MKTLTAGDCWKRGDLAIRSSDGNFVDVLTQGSTSGISDHFEGSLRPENDQDVIDYAVSHPEVFESGCFSTVYKHITKASLSENDRYWMEIRRKK